MGRQIRLCVAAAGNGCDDGGGTVSVALLQDTADLIPPEEFLDPGRKTLFIFNIKCDTVHSADLMYVFGVLW